MTRIFQINETWYLEKHHGEKKSLRTKDREVADKALAKALEEKAVCRIDDITLKNIKGEGWIYFVQAEKGGLVKVGYTEDMHKKFKTIQAHSPLTMQIIGKIRGSKSTEEEIHFKFRRDRKHGEWFEPSGRMTRLIEIYGWKEEFEPIPEYLIRAANIL